MGAKASVQLRSVKARGAAEERRGKEPQCRKARFRDTLKEMGLSHTVSILEPGLEDQLLGKESPC